MQMTRTQWLMLITLSVLWGGAYFTGKIAVAHFSPFALLFWRALIAALFLGGLMFITKTPLPKGKTAWLTLLSMSLLNVVLPMSLIFYGLTGVTSGLGAIINATTPIFTVLVLHFMTTDEKITWPKAIGVALGFLGVVVLMGLEGESKSFIFILAGLLAAFFYGVSALYGRRLNALKLPTLAIAFGQMASASVIMLGINLIFMTNFFVPPPELKTYLAVLTLGVLCTGVAYLLFFRILMQAGGTNIMLVTFLIPVSSLILGTLFLNETMKYNHLLGMGLIGLGLVAIDGRMIKASPKTS